MSDFVKTTDIIEGTSLWQDAYKRLRKNRIALVGGAVVLFLTAACFLGPLVLSAAWPRP